ncbi:titin homolog isoform X1 [Agrilus planipennis]|uniref:Titin homolog isoform X1 n=1 Tax=Agrilus planipennis TaxID=224129 RepID=A0A7F5RED3_AGRPL|nr:titin homolog isoform X1 [Agrilus planipennis]
METNEPNSKDTKNELDLDGKTNESFTKSDENVNEPLDEISLSPEEEATSTPATKDTRSRIEEKADSKRKLKRRLSVQSSYSRISLTKQSILDRIKSTKRSIKPSRLVKRSRSDVTYEKKPINTKGRKSIDTTKHIDKPVYIHIPLKPPPGQTDEFSYLEFEKDPPPVGQLPEKKNGKKEVFGDDRDGSPIVGVILEFDDPDKKDGYTSKEINDIISKMGNGANVQQIDAKDLFPEIAEQSAKIKEIVDSIDDKAKIVATDGKEVLEEVEVNNKAEVLEKLKQVENGSTQSIKATDDKDVQNNSLQPPVPQQQQNEQNHLNVQSNDGVQIQEMSSREGSTSSASNRSPGMLTDKPITSEPDEDNISQYLDKDEPIEVESSRTESAEPEGTTKVNTDIVEKIQPLKGSDLDVPKNRKRARSEEPSTRKRKLSIESSYSRKSLSKLAFLKKFKNFTDKIKIPSLKKSESKEKIKEKPKEEKKEDDKEVAQPKTKDNLKKSKKEEPKYIYIPLKPPEGETDEFSKFADEPPTESNVSNKELKREDTETSVETPTNDVQIIILTPPSDDEILDSNLPETPSETDQKFFDNMQIDNLKHLAKKVVDEVYPNSHELQTVQEEKTGSDENLTKNGVIEETNKKEDDSIKTEQKIEEEPTKTTPEESKVPPKEIDGASKEERVVLQERILVDEEDGLKLSEVAVAMINEELAKESLPQTPSDKVKETPAAVEDVVKIKKKVLFKNKKKTDDGEYEYITIPDSQRSSYAEDKPEESDTCQIKEDVELIKDKHEEGSPNVDGKKWSEIDDHEYEPINPPSDEMAHSGPPKIHITTPQLHTRIHDVQHDSALSSTTSLERQYLGGANGDEDLSTRNADIEEAAVTPQELQTQIEERFFTVTPMTAPSKQGTDIANNQTDSSTVQSVSATKNDSKKSGEDKPEDQQGNKFNEAIKHQAEALKAQAGKIKSKFQNMKKPSISKPKFQAPSFKMPKLGDRAKIHMPSFKKNTEKRSSWQEQRQFSTESNVGEPKKHFDFGTFPKLFDRSKKGRKGSLGDFDSAPSNVQTNEAAPQPEFATVPRATRKKEPVGSRWSSKFKDIDFADDEQKENLSEQRPTSVRISLHEEIEDIPGDGSHIRYNQDIDIEEDFEREDKQVHEVSPLSQEYLKRWEHGEFHEGPVPARHRLQITDLDEPQTPPELELPRSNGVHSSGSLSDHRRGVIEEIDSDEFFLREKGISQEDIEVGKYLSTEIREAFRNPVNSLSQIDGLNGESDQSLQEPPPRKKPARKPKRKKTPHVSQENVSFDQESVTEPEEYRTDDIRSYPPPSRPKRRSKSKKSKKNSHIPYQETIAMDEENYNLDENLRDIESDILPDNILSSDVQQNGFHQNTRQVYENEHMQGIEQPEIVVSNPYAKRDFQPETEQPAPPPRKHRSLKSLNISEQDSILDDSIDYKDTPMQEMVVYRGEHEYIIPTPEPPQRSRKTRSRSQSHVDDDRTSRGADSLTSENLVPVVEEICIKDIRDSSGYAIIDKQKPRDPPLPPSRFPTTPPRKRKNKNIEKTKVITQTKFFTVPRKQQSAAPPERPTRNYSTLGSPSKPIRKKSLSSSHVNADNKENIDISQYTEIEDQPVRRLQSGEIVQKMKDRPLPAPPRPPRRQRDGREALQDITNGDSQPSGSEEKEHLFDETEVSTQTEPLPDDVICEPLTQEETDRVILPTEGRKAENRKQESFEETITHGALIVQPLPYSALHQTGPGVERVIPTRLEESDEETSEIPEDFKKLKSPSQPTESSADKRPITPTFDSSAEIELLKTQKLQVADLDVDKLRVNQLQANKIMVSEIEGFSIQVNEINSRSGNLVVSGIELPPHLLQELVDRLQSIVPQQSSQFDEEQSASQRTETESTLKNRQESVPEESKKGEESEQQKKTPINEETIIEESIIASQVAESHGPLKEQFDEAGLQVKSEHVQNLENQQLLLNQQAPGESEDEPPKRPPRKASVTSASITQETEEETQLNSSSQKAPPSSNYSASASSLQSINANEPSSTKEVKESEREEPPPRPPQPEYIASQPPASFFALRSQPYSELLTEAIPMPPRRKRHFRATLVTQSSSEDNISPPRRHRSPEPSIPQLTGQLTRACIISGENLIRRLIASFSDNVLRNKDGKQDAYVMIIILLVLIAGILLLTGDPKIIVHHHHWEYFNPPRDL